MFKQSLATLKIMGQIVVVLGALFVIVAGAARVWEKAKLFQVKAVSYAGDIPEKLPAILRLAPGQNIVTLKPSDLERLGLKAFPELDALRVTRRIDKTVAVSGRYRREVAVLERNGKPFGIDAGGVIFPIGPKNPAKEGRPVIVGNPGNDAADIAAALARLETRHPDFYLAIKEIKTDRILPVSLTLNDGVGVIWGRLAAEDVEEKMTNVMRVRQKFTPKKLPAVIRFVENDRLVVDANWKPLQSE
jgi:cell division septal protein FtsQ